MKILSGAFFLSILFCLFSSQVYAQDCDPFLDPFCEPVPLDNGTHFLIIIAIVYAAARLRSISRATDSGS